MWGSLRQSIFRWTGAAAAQQRPPKPACNGVVSCTVRRAVTGALEIERKDKRIGSSLEAAPIVYVAASDLYDALKELDFAEICITSDISVIFGEGPADAVRAEDNAQVSVVASLAEGRKCARSWRITKDVGSDPDYPDVSARDAAALRELAALARTDEGQAGAAARHP
eukprot:gene57262-78466_t